MNKKVSLTENELEAIFSGRATGRKSDIKSYLFPIIIFLVVALAIFSILNFAAIKKISTFWFNGEFSRENKPAEPKTTLAVSNDPNVTRIRVPKIGNNILKIESLNLEAPITWRVKNEPDTVSAALQNGIIQMDGTALPGENGNVFITGHSSNYAWAKGSYNAIFALLNNLVVGDSVVLKYQDKYFVYSVREKKIVSADDISVMDKTDKPILSLMTCWPVGTAYKRLIIIADQTYPDPNKNSLPENKTRNSKLPNVH